MPNESEQPRFGLCVLNTDCEDLELRKVYLVLPDESAAADGYVRVVDESGEDYLYPESFFVLIQLPSKAAEAVSLGRHG